MSRLAPLAARFNALAPRERAMVVAAVALVVLAFVWLALLAPALGTLRAADVQRASIDAQLQRMAGLQAQALSLQAQPRPAPEETMRLLERSVRERLGPGGRMSIAGDRVTVALAGVPPDTLAQWLAQARANARVTPSEAHLSRNAAGQWDGTVVITLPGAR